MLSTDMHSKQSFDAEAGDWLARLDSAEVTPQLRAQFESWRTSDSRRAAAYARLEATWQLLDRIQAVRPAGGEADPDHLLHSMASVSERSESVRAGWGRYRYWALAASVVVAVVSIWMSMAPHWRSSTYSTGVGGFQRIVLSDASVMELNTATRVRVDFSNSLRRIELLQGEANFKVARDASRPFVVTAGETAVRAVGTSFNVRRSAEQVEVIVTEGRVAVGATSAVAQGASSALPPTAPVVGAGQSAVAGGEGLKLHVVSTAVVGRKLAWQGGMLVFEGDPLREVVAEFNRYNDKQLVVEDPAAAQFKVGGYFRPTNLEAFVEVLRTKLGMRVTVAGERIILGAPRVRSLEGNISSGD